MSDLEPAPNGYPIKLVRDRTPDVINPSDKPGELFYGVLPDDVSPLPWLKRKLAEEVGEYLIDGGFRELLDVLAVVEGLALAHGRSMAYAIAEVHLHPRGGFEEGMMMYGRHPEYDNA